MFRDSGFVFEQAAQQDLKDIAQIHHRIFGCDLSGRLGKNFLKHYYQKMKASSDGIIVVCKEQGRVVGFISGLSAESDFLLKAAAANLLSIFVQCIVHPLSFLRFLKRNIIFKEGEFKAELTSLAILEEYRGKGIAPALLLRLEEFFKNKKVKNYKVYTDAKYGSGCRFYEKSGFSLHQEADLFGNQARLYVKTIPG